MTKIMNKANLGHKIEIKIDKEIWERYPISTHLIHIKEDISPILKEIKKNLRKDDFIAISEKFITISEGRVIHKSFLKPSLLAKFLYKIMRLNMSEKAYQKDPGYAIPEKIQAAIIISGWWRIFYATALGIPLTIIWKIFGKKKGWFYILAGNRISEIDGIFSDEMYPFNEFVKIYPENPQKSAEKIEEKYGIPTTIIDGNNINTEILGISNKINLTKKEIREILLDNPMGQGSELTPIILIRKNVNFKK